MSMNKNPVDILSPHLDDAAYSCWHGIERYDAHVVTVFAGAAMSGAPSKWDRRSGFESSTEAIQVRRQENLQALGIAGMSAGNIVDLDLPEAGYRIAEQSVDEIVEVLHGSLRDEASVIAPIGMGCLHRSHVDHVAVREVAKRLEQEGREVSYYADIPYLLPLARFRRWPLRLDRRRLTNALESDGVAVEAIELAADEQKRKKLGMLAYRSQFKANNISALGTFFHPSMPRWEGVIRPVKKS